MLSIIPAALFLLVITNDLHQQVFAFKSGVPGLPVSGTCRGAVTGNCHSATFRKWRWTSSAL